MSNSVNFENFAYNAVQQVYPIVVDNEAGIVIKFGERWSNIEYHEGRVIIYRNEQGRISIIEVEYDD